MFGCFSWNSQTHENMVSFELQKKLISFELSQWKPYLRFGAWLTSPPSPFPDCPESRLNLPAARSIIGWEILVKSVIFLCFTWQEVRVISLSRTSNLGSWNSPWRQKFFHSRCDWRISTYSWFWSRRSSKRQTEEEGLPWMQLVHKIWNVFSYKTSLLTSIWSVS